MTSINRTKVEVETVYNCKFCGEEVYKCDNCEKSLLFAITSEKYLLSDTTIHDIFCDTSNPNIKHYCVECGEESEAEREAKKSHLITMEKQI